MVHSYGARHAHLAILRPFGILLLSPLIIAVSTAVLLGLLAIFVTWLLVVAVLVSAIVASDIVRGALRSRAPSGALLYRAAGSR